MNPMSIFWLGLLVSLIFSVIFSQKSLKKSLLKDFRLADYTSSVVITVIVLLIIYSVFAFLGQSSRGYIIVIAFAFSAVFSILSHAGHSLFRNNKNSTLLGSVFTVGFCLAGLALLFEFFNNWNDSGKVPFLLTGYGLGAALLAFVLRNNESEVNKSQDLFAVFSLAFISAIIITNSKTVLLIGSLGLLGVVLSAVAAGKSCVSGFILSNVLGIGALLCSAYFLEFDLVAPGIVGIFMSLLLLPVSLFYSESKYRPAKSAAKGNIAPIIMEVSAIIFLIAGIGFLVSYFLGSWSGNPAIGIAFACLGVITPAGFMLYSSKSSDRAKTIAKVYSTFYAAVVVILMFVIYKLQLQSLGNFSVVDLYTIKTIIGLFAGAGIILICSLASLCRFRPAALVTAVVSVSIAAFLLKAQAMAALLTGVVILGIPVSWMLLISNIVLERLPKQEKQEVQVYDPGSICMLLIAALVLVIVPLII